MDEDELNEHGFSIVDEDDLDLDELNDDKIKEEDENSDDKFDRDN